ncbi:TetR/AcrR family transcriptional regulator [Streptomyces fuscichromogenes]|uniref:TetR/AcrR family transcriptional regulator n=1 Tax=Streptomyces fuscichromogenes TaxID=1324013 RepID=UPI00381C74CE
MGTKGRRLSPQERRQEMLDAALDLADAVGLDRLTSRDIGTSIGVAPGLVHHYFASMDELIVEAFAQFADAEHDELRSIIQSLPVLPALCGLVTRQLNAPTRYARIWMSAWVAAPRRPELAKEIDRQMLAGLDLLTGLLGRGADEGAFQLSDPRESAFRILVLLDGVLVQISMRAEKSYGDVTKLVWESVEREVGLTAGTLSGPGGIASTSR